MKFEKLIKEIQVNSGLNQKDFSESIGINRDTFRGWTKKTPHYISREILETISYLYNVPVFKLLDAIQESQKKQILGFSPMPLMVTQENVHSILIGDEKVVVHNILTAFGNQYPALNQADKSRCQRFLRNSIRFLNSVSKDELSFLTLKDFVSELEQSSIKNIMKKYEQEFIDDELLDYFTNLEFADDDNTQNMFAIITDFIEEIIFNFDLISEKVENAKSEKFEVDEEDAILGHKIDLRTGTVTDEPVILSAKDRFLHTLILGPTGCGKTSQTMLPMIWHDMQIKNKTVGITVLEPKGDLAEKVYAMAKYHNNKIDAAFTQGNYSREKYGEKKTVLYFNPIVDGCPYFNPLEGDEDDVIENMSTVFNLLNMDTTKDIKASTDILIRNAVKLLKRLYGDEATLLDLNTLIWNMADKGLKEYVMALKRKLTMPDGSPIPTYILKENDELIDWFLNDYYAGIGGAKGVPKTYENTTDVRTQISKLIENKYLNKILNPPRVGNTNYNEYLAFQQKCAEEGIPHKLNFDEAFEKGYIIAMSTAQGTLCNLGRFLGYFIILQLQASVFRRPGNENTRIHNMLYIDEFQVFSNPGFADMLTMGRSYRVASHIATPSQIQIGMGLGKMGKDFIKFVSTYARNKIIYPGVSYDDAKYYSDEFKTNSRKLRKTFTPLTIMDRTFGEITYRLTKNNAIDNPGIAKTSYIPKDVDDALNKIILNIRRNIF